MCRSLQRGAPRGTETDSPASLPCNNITLLSVSAAEQDDDQSRYAITALGASSPATQTMEVECGRPGPRSSAQHAPM